MRRLSSIRATMPLMWATCSRASDSRSWRVFDLGKQDFEHRLREFAEKLEGASSAIFFYAGTGYRWPGKLPVPIDAKLETAAAVNFETVKLELVQRTMETEERSNILFIDACRNNPLARNLARAMGTRSTQIGRGLAQVQAGAGTLVSFSTQPGNVALDGTGRNSPFAVPSCAKSAPPRTT